jgi:hypothetical protein
MVFGRNRHNAGMFGRSFHRHKKSLARYKITGIPPLEKRMNVAQLLKDKRSDILEIAAKNGAHNVRVFGSIARGEDTDTSDIDFLVDMEPRRSLLDVAGLLIDLENLLGCRVDVVTTKGLKKSLRDQVLNEAIAL